MLQSPNDFLSYEESMAVDQSLLSAKEKFSTRVAIYSLRVLQTMVKEQSIAGQSTAEKATAGQATADAAAAIQNITPPKLSQWLTTHQDTLQNALPEAPAGLEPDPAFNQFFTQIVLSSLRPLKQIAAETNISLVELQSNDVIAWFEKEARVRVDQGETSTFLGQNLDTDSSGTNVE